MLELIFSVLIEILFNVAIQVPGVCIAVLTGRSSKDLSEGRIFALSFAFWGVIIMFGLIVWAIASWIRVVAT